MAKLPATDGSDESIKIIAHDGMAFHARFFGQELGDNSGLFPPVC